VDQGLIQWSYGFLVGALRVGRVIGWAISLAEMKKTEGVYPRKV